MQTNTTYGEQNKMQRKPQFYVSAEKRTFFDRKVLNYGSSRTVAMGKIIPKGWPYVRMTIIEQDKDSRMILIEKLFLGVEHARNTKANKTGGHNP